MGSLRRHEFVYSSNAFLLEQWQKQVRIRRLNQLELTQSFFLGKWTALEGTDSHQSKFSEIPKGAFNMARYGCPLWSTDDAIYPQPHPAFPSWQEFCWMNYPLVNIQKTMENHNF
jgi:hypothetical protein